MTTDCDCYILETLPSSAGFLCYAGVEKTVGVGFEPTVPWGTRKSNQSTPDYQSGALNLSANPPLNHGGAQVEPAHRRGSGAYSVPDDLRFLFCGRRAANVYLTDGRTLRAADQCARGISAAQGNPALRLGKVKRLGKSFQEK